MRNLLAFCTLMSACQFRVPRYDATVQVCAPDSTQPCFCASGNAGTQSCATDGSQFSVCDCLAVRLRPSEAIVAVGGVATFEATVLEDGANEVELTATGGSIDSGGVSSPEQARDCLQ